MNTQVVKTALTFHKKHWPFEALKIQGLLTSQK